MKATFYTPDEPFPTAPARVSVALVADLPVHTTPAWITQAKAAVEDLPVTVYVPTRERALSPQASMPSPMWGVAAVQAADVVYAWVDPYTPASTLLLIGYAMGQVGVDVIVAGPQSISDRHIDLLTMGHMLRGNRELGAVHIVQDLQKAVEHLRERCWARLDFYRTRRVAPTDPPATAPAPAD